MPRLVSDLCRKAKLIALPTTSQCFYAHVVTRDDCAIYTAQGTTLRCS